MITFTVPGTPVPKARARVTRVNGVSRAYTPKKTVEYERLVARCAREAMDGRLIYEAGVALKMILSIYIEPPKSWIKKRRDDAISGCVYPTSKPDSDNICKGVSDALNGIVYADDAQIVNHYITKRYSDSSKISVSISQIY